MHEGAELTLDGRQRNPRLEMDRLDIAWTCLDALQDLGFLLAKYRSKHGRDVEFGWFAHHGRFILTGFLVHIIVVLCRKRCTSSGEHIASLSDNFDGRSASPRRG